MAGHKRATTIVARGGRRGGDPGPELRELSAVRARGAPTVKRRLWPSSCAHAAARHAAVEAAQQRHRSWSGGSAFLSRGQSRRSEWRCSSGSSPTLTAAARSTTRASPEHCDVRSAAPPPRSIRSRPSRTSSRSSCNRLPPPARRAGELQPPARRALARRGSGVRSRGGPRSAAGRVEPRSPVAGSHEADRAAGGIGGDGALGPSGQTIHDAATRYDPGGVSREGWSAP
jgi:hypothetical protein